jgi:hypothetical protein
MSARFFQRLFDSRLSWFVTRQEGLAERPVRLIIAIQARPEDTNKPEVRRTAHKANILF